MRILYYYRLVIRDAWTSKKCELLYGRNDVKASEGDRESERERETELKRVKSIENDINNSIPMKLMKSHSVKTFYYVLVVFLMMCNMWMLWKRSVYRFSTYQPIQRVYFTWNVRMPLFCRTFCTTTISRWKFPLVMLQTMIALVMQSTTDLATTKYQIFTLEPI